MSEYRIPEVSSIPKVTQSTHTVERVHKNARGEYVSNWTNYVITLYDYRGRLVTTHSNYTTSITV